MELLPHQEICIQKANKRHGFGYFTDMGTGKTVITLYEAQLLYMDKLIDNIVVVCPKGAETVWYEHAKLLLHDPSILTVYRYPMAKHIPKSSITDRTLLIGDESHFFKSSKGVLTKTMITLSKQAKYKRICSGTPVTNTPFDAYSQLLFIEPLIWWRLGLRSMYDFKNHFCERNHILEKRMKDKNKLRRAPFMAKRDNEGNVMYKNMEQYSRLLDSVSITISKEDANLNLPQKIHSTVFYSMTDEQREHYNTLESDMFLQLAEWPEDEFIEADSNMVLAIRLHQMVTSHPQRHELALSLTKNRPAIIFCRFLDEVKAIKALADAQGIRNSVYTGGTGTTDRKRIVNDFQQGKIDLIIANAHTAGRAITLTRAEFIIYASKSHNWEHLKQSQDRAHRIGLKHDLNIIHIEAENSVDQHITKSLNSKSSLIQGLKYHAKSIHSTSPDNHRPSFITAEA